MSLQQKTIEKLAKLIENYPYFNEENKKLWKERIKILPPEYVLFLVDLFENSPEDVIFLDENIKEKGRILEKGDEKAWQNLLETEKNFLEKLIEQKI